MVIGNRMLLLIAFLTIGAFPLYAHCDGWDGPVVKAGLQALATGNLNLALIWVPATDENEIRSLFEKSLRVRALSPGARELADTYFLETLVRLHRAGEGEGYTGLKAAGRDLGPIIPAFDRAVLSEQADLELTGLFPATHRPAIENGMRDLRARRNFQPDDVTAGREFVHHYVALLHHLLELQEGGHQGEHHHEER